MILFSANISSRHRTNLKEKFPNEHFQFCKNMNEAKKHINNAEVLVTYGEDITANLVEQAPHLKWIMVISAGMDQMPFGTIEQQNILVTNVRGIHKIPMAEYVISMLLQVYRQEKLLIYNERTNHWDKSVKMREISGNTMLIVGTGAIGQEVARLAKAFQMKTLGISRSGRQADFIDATYRINKLDTVLPKADFVVSVLPSTEETKYLYSFNHFKLMKNTAIFLNMGRGDVVSSEDILKAVKEREIEHAILDVFEQEPLPEEHPLWQEDNITITPHLSGVSTSYVTRSLDIFMKNLSVYREGSGSYINKIDTKRGY